MKEIDWLFQHQRMADTMGTSQAKASGKAWDPPPGQATECFEAPQ